MQSMEIVPIGKRGKQIIREYRAHHNDMFIQHQSESAAQINNPNIQTRAPSFLRKDPTNFPSTPSSRGRPVALIGSARRSG